MKIEWRRWFGRGKQAAARLAEPVNERDHVLGAAQAPVTLVEYGDYGCPTCSRAFPMIQELQQRYRNDLRFVFRHFPVVEQHPRAFRAAQAAEAAALQGAFWGMHERLFRNQQALADEDLMEYARSLGLDQPRFSLALGSEAVRARVEENLASGRASGVQLTPTFFINGERYTGEIEFEALADFVDRLRREPS